MQLQMTAPLDIGLEQYDASLGIGQEDIFDLGGAEQDLRKGRGVSELVGEDSDVSDTELEGETPSDREDVDATDETERKVAGLEDELDQLYNAYQQRLRERDAKAKVKQARQTNPERRAEWHGVKEDSDEEEEEDEGEGDIGGWENMQRTKQDPSDHSSSDDESDSDSEPLNRERRKRRLDSEDNVNVSPKRLRLVTSLEDRRVGATSRAAQVWFSQDVFSGIEGLGDVEDGDHDKLRCATLDSKETVRAFSVLL